MEQRNQFMERETIAAVTKTAKIFPVYDTAIRHIDTVVRDESRTRLLVDLYIMTRKKYNVDHHVQCPHRSFVQNRKWPFFVAMRKKT